MIISIINKFWTCKWRTNGWDSSRHSQSIGCVYHANGICHLEHHKLHFGLSQTKKRMANETLKRGEIEFLPSWRSNMNCKRAWCWLSGQLAWLSWPQRRHVGACQEPCRVGKHDSWVRKKYSRGKMSTPKRLKGTSYSGNQDGDEAKGRRAGKVTHSVSLISGYRRQWKSDSEPSWASLFSRSDSVS